MRRWIFAALVLANVGMFIWGVFYLEAERNIVPEPEPSIAPEKMRPLDKRESMRGKPGPVRPAAELKPVSAPVPTDVARLAGCYRVGPLAESAHAQAVEQILAELSQPNTRREETARMVTGYRVYLPPLKSRGEAERKRRELTKLGFKDHAVMQEEGFQNALSLGKFSVEENAQSHVRKLAAKGVQAKVHPVEQTRPIYWVEIGSPAVTPDDLRARLKGVKGAVMQEIPCSAPAAPQPTANETARPG